MKNYFYVIIIIVFGLLILNKNKSNIENFQVHLAQPTKCVSCENQFKNDNLKEASLCMRSVNPSQVINWLIKTLNIN